MFRITLAAIITLSVLMVSVPASGEEAPAAPAEPAVETSNEPAQAEPAQTEPAETEPAPEEAPQPAEPEKPGASSEPAPAAAANASSAADMAPSSPVEPAEQLSKPAESAQGREDQKPDIAPAPAAAPAAALAADPAAQPPVLQAQEPVAAPKPAVAEAVAMPVTAATPTIAEKKPAVLPTAPPPPVAAQTPAAAKPSARDNAYRTWQFLKESGKDTREEMVDTILLQVTEFLRTNADWDFSDEARLLKADLEQRKGDHRSAAVDLLMIIYEYPNSRSVLQAKSILADLVDRKLGKKVKPLFTEASKGSEAKDKPKRISRMLKKLVSEGGDALYEPLAAELSLFSARFPDYSGSDEMVLITGELHAKKERFLASLAYYRKLLALYPESRLRPKALRSIGDLFFQNLKDNTGAANTFQELISQYPDSEEAGYAYEQLARIEEQLKHYDLAIEIYEKLIRLYPKTPPAMRAFLNEAGLQREQLDRPQEAVQTLGRLADMFKGSSDAAEALKSAAALARKQKKYDQEAALYLRIVQECTGISDAPELLLQAAQVSDEDLGNKEKALEFYRMLLAKYPDSKQAKKAKSRIEGMTKR